MKVRFDFVMHWIWAIVFSILALSGLAMVGARYGWIMNYDITSADLIHRVFAAIFVLLTFISITYEVIRGLRNDESKLAWFIIGKKGYQIFTFITTLIFIITGVIIWVCMDSNKQAAAFAMYIHEKLTYIVIVSVIWHIYEKSHALVISKKSKANAKAKKLSQGKDQGKEIIK